ncbi:MAG: hypothetical protein CMJ32_07480 [Phycisphaerae bacterium]|nr:hypothetical protein [Phycisphaerae bacterium]
MNSSGFRIIWTRPSSHLSGSSGRIMAVIAKVATATRMAHQGTRSNPSRIHLRQIVSPGM